MLLRTEEDVQLALQLINQAEILAYDTETTGLNVRKDRVLGFGVSTPYAGFYCPLLSYDPVAGQLVDTGLRESALLLLQALSRKKLIIFNASYDARITKHNLGVDLLPALHADVLLMKHTCDEEFPFGLKEIAAKLFGTSVTQEKEEMQASIKANGGTKTQYWKADTTLLGKYCIQDCRLTYRLYSYYLADLKRQGLEAFYFKDEVLPLYTEVTIPMEERGVALDIPLLQTALLEINRDLDQLEDEIQAAIAPVLPDVFIPWFLNKDYPLLTPTGKPSMWRKQYPDQAAAWRAESTDRYMFNLRSKHHLKKLFFNTLGEGPKSTTPTGQPQVDEEFLQSLVSKYPWVAKLIDFNALTKIKGTYIERLLEEAEDGRFYPAFMQHRTVSGRYAGDLQQLPRPIDDGAASPVVRYHNNRIRAFIIADPDALLVSADYEQLEPSIFSHTSGDPKLQAIFHQGHDFYSTIAIGTERLDGVSADKTAPNYLGKVNKAKRQAAKPYSLGIPYGMSGYKLQFELGIPQAEAERLVEQYLAAFPDLAAWMERSKNQARLFGYVKTELGRVRRLPMARALWKKYGPKISDPLALYAEYGKTPHVYKRVKEDYRRYKNEMNNAINFQVQGLAASVVNRAAIAIARKLRALGHKALIVMQVHDELVLSVPQTELEPVCALVQEIMQGIVTLSVPLRTMPQAGQNFKQCK